MSGSKLQLALLLLTACISSTLAVSCGSLGDVPLSGCSACDAVNITRSFGGHNGWKGRNLRHFGGPGHDFHPGKGPKSFLAPSCTECDTANGFILRTGFEGKGGKSAAGRFSADKPARCGCAAPMGVKITDFVNVTMGNWTIPIPQFTCVACGTTQVPFGRDSGLVPYYDGTTWNLVLSSSTLGLKVEAERKAQFEAWSAKRSTADQTASTSTVGERQPGPQPDNSNEHGKGHGKRPPFMPGSCVDCPAGSKVNDAKTTCVQA